MEQEQVNANEPVAYVTGLNKFDLKMVDTVLKVGTPLYTHPASLVNWSYQQGYQIGKETHPAKTLTDEEIIEIWSGMETDTGEQNIAFARAILRKAQE